MTVSTAQHWALELGRLRKHHAGDTERERTLRRRIAEARIEEFVAKIVAESPPISSEARQRIAGLLTPDEAA